MTPKKRKKGNTATDRNTQREDNMNNRGENVMWREGRDWSDASLSQGRSRMASDHQEVGERPGTGLL